jgi:hypothetical protein
VAILGEYIIDGESKIRENTLLFYHIELKKNRNISKIPHRNSKILFV